MSASLQVSFSLEEYDELERIAHRRGVPRSAVVRHSLALYRQLAEMEKNGCQLIAAHPDGEREIKIVGFIEPNRHRKPRLIEGRKEQAR